VIVSGCLDSSIRIWDVASRRLLDMLGGQRKHSDSVRCVAFSRDGTMLASASDDCSVILWDFPAGGSPAPLAAAPSPQPIIDLASGSGGDQGPQQGGGQGQAIKTTRTETCYFALETLRNRSALEDAIRCHLPAGMLYSGTVLEVEMEKIRKRVHKSVHLSRSSSSEHPTPCAPFIATIAQESLIARAREQLRKLDSGPQASQNILQVRYDPVTP
jgi:hypothetical protein